MSDDAPVSIGSDKHLTVESFVRVARARHPVHLGEAEKQHVHDRRTDLERKLAQHKDVGFYGINTGFGSLATCVLPQAKGKALSRNIITSHSVGTGEPLPEEVVRGAMLLRAHSLGQGYSGVKPATVEIFVDALNEQWFPVVPSQGSLGASGDLAPLSHLALALTRPETEDVSEDLGMLWIKGEQPAGAKHFADAQGQVWHAESAKRMLGDRRVVLDCKEGLALNNGTSVSLSLATLAVQDTERLLHQATRAIALTYEAMHAVRDPLFAELHALRPHEGSKRFAAEMRALLEGSQLIDGDVDRNPKRLPPQDPYSLRCSPAAFAAFWQALEYAKTAVEVELNAVTDNPLVIPLSRSYAVVSGGHFHGDPIAIPMDTLKITLTKLASLSERLIFQMTDATNRGIPPMILAVPESEHGLNSGFMIHQYTAAALVNECSTLSHPSSVHSIPSSANQEDYVSMSMNAARHCRRVLENVEQVVSLLLLSAAQAIDAQNIDPSMLAQGTRKTYKAIRKQVSVMREDRAMVADMENLVTAMRNGHL